MLDVLAVAPHPDDIELTAGGTVASLTAAGMRVGFLDLTRGERSTRGTPELRAAESAEAARRLGVALRENLDLGDGGLDARNPDQLQALVGALRTHRPRLVLAMHDKDDHPDHIEAAHLVRRAAFLAGLRNYPGGGGEPHRPQRVLFAMGRQRFEPTVIVDVTAVYGVKRNAVEAYRSQFFRDPGDPLTTPISEPGFLDRIAARDREYGAWIGVEYGEPFASDHALGLAARDLVPEARG